ncbi:MAG TPA: TolC family protein [Terriglobales bacterium]|nr:TolC family protein [Terriglobales bacterium]
MKKVALLLIALSTGSVAQNNAPAPAASQPAANAPLRLTIADAEALALKNNPQITVARLNALASHQVTRETRSGFFPTASINFTGVDATEGSRIGAGALNNPVLYDRAAAGTTLSQLITDFGRTSNLVASSKLRAQAEDENARATAQQISLAADTAFYNALQASALLKVADETIKSRQLVVDRIQALTNAKLKSDLDLSFANVDLSQAQLLQLEAQNNYNAALASLSSILGYPTLQNLNLVEDTATLQPPSPNVDDLIHTALQTRPDLNALQYAYESATKFRNAEHDLSRPTISALATVGSVPFDNGHLEPWYGAVGANISVPVFNGFLFSARAKEADLRAQAAEQRRRDLANRISSDVRTAWLDSVRTYKRLDVTRQLLNQASLAQDLAETRYKLGLGTIVEYTQAELQRTQAEIGNTSAQYEYRLAQERLKYQLGQK